MSHFATTPFPREDLELALLHSGASLECLKGRKILITGATGFFGRWLVETLVVANQIYGLGATITFLARDLRPGSTAQYLSTLDRVTPVQGDVRCLDLRPMPLDYVIHAATPVSTIETPLVLWDTIVAGTRNTLEYAVQSGAERFLLISSGAVYGKQPPTEVGIEEDFSGAPTSTEAASVYGEGKRAAELMAAIYQDRIGCLIARCFAFVGPGLSLDGQFAIGNFIRNALRGEDIVIKGDGRAMRSYLYMSDLVSWLLRILTHGRRMAPYNVGSDRAISVGDLAKLVQENIAPGRNVRIMGAQVNTSSAAMRYLPSVARIKSELAVDEYVGISDAIRRTAAWCREIYD